MNVTPDGRLRDSDNVQVGHPVDLTVKVPDWPTSKVVWSSLVILHASLTVRVKVWVASGLTPFVAVIVNVYVPAGARRWCSRECRRAVPVVRPREPRRQCGRLGQCASGQPSRLDGKGPGLADGKGGGGQGW